MSFETPGIYRSLGLRRVVNAFEVVSLYGGSVMRPGVARAMAEAASGFYDIPGLIEAVGKRLAELTRNEAATVTSGTSASLALAAAACMAGDSRVLRESLPFPAAPCARDAASGSCAPGTAVGPGLPDPTAVRGLPPSGGRDEIVVFACQRNPYDRALRLPGGRIVTVGYPTHHAAHGQLEDAITPRTACVVYFAGALFERYALSIEETAAIARRRGVPLVVDGAAQIPPRENLWNYTARGANLALFSGGKGIRGPQDTGLVVGDATLVARIAALASPHQAFGRPMKTSKEAIVGLLRAVELLLEEDYESVYAEMLRGLEGLLAETEHGVFESRRILATGRHGQRYPRAVYVLRDRSPGARERFMKALLEEGDPPVLVGPLDEDDRAFYVNPFGFQDPEEYGIVASRIRETCGRHAHDGK